MSTNRPAFGMTHEQLEREWVEARDRAARLQKENGVLRSMVCGVVASRNENTGREAVFFTVALVAIVLAVYFAFRANRKLDTPPPPPAAVEVSYAADEPRGWWWRLMPRSVRPITVTRRIWTMAPA